MLISINKVSENGGSRAVEISEDSFKANVLSHVVVDGGVEIRDYCNILNSTNPSLAAI